MGLTIDSNLLFAVNLSEVENRAKFSTGVFDEK
jgi:hypothetical protein